MVRQSSARHEPGKSSCISLPDPEHTMVDRGAGADGLRLDTFPYVSRTFWHDFHSQLHAIYPKLTTVGEVFNGTFDMYRS